jgi:hypothetical protein
MRPNVKGPRSVPMDEKAGQTGSAEGPEVYSGAQSSYSWPVGERGTER